MASENYQNAVMEIAPWTYEKRFAGSSLWWDYILSKSERMRLESLIGLALLDQSICGRLLEDHDEALLNEFGLSEETKQWLNMLKADTLHELAEAISTSIDMPSAISCYSEAA